MFLNTGDEIVNKQPINIIYITWRASVFQNVERKESRKRLTVKGIYFEIIKTVADKWRLDVH